MSRSRTRAPRSVRAHLVSFTAFGAALAALALASPAAAELITSTDGCYESHDTFMPPDDAPPTVNFRDISGTGTPLGLAADSASAALPIGFSFYYYGIEYTDVYVATNGFLTFQPPVNTTASDGSNMPNTNDPNTTIAGFWKEHDVTLGGEIYTELQGAPGSREFIVQWDMIPAPDAGGLFPSTFQIILQEQLSAIEIQYRDADALNRRPSAGIENETGQEGLTVFRDDEMHLIDEAIRITGVGDDDDGDRLVTCFDNCPDVSNIMQADADLDGYGDACDTCVGPGDSDADGDLLCSDEDNCPDISNASQEDMDGGTGMFTVVEGLDTIAPGVAIRFSPTDGGGALVGENVEFACGGCAVADFLLSVPEVGNGNDLCGFSSSIPREIVEREIPLCARDMLSMDLYELDLETFGPRSRTSCYDADDGESCDAVGGVTSYTRTPALGGAPVNVVSSEMKTFEFAPGLEVVVEQGIDGDRIEWACGPCTLADFEDSVSRIGGGRDICGYSNNIPRNIVMNGDLLCAREEDGERTWEVELHSWNGPGGPCVDTDAGVTCAATLDQASLSWAERDGYGDACDNCPSVSNLSQADRNDNGVGDACDDPDADGLVDIVDNCPDVANADQANDDGEAETVTLGFTDTLEDGVAIVVQGGLHAIGGRWSCGTCAKADFADSQVVIGSSEDICGFSSNIPRRIVEEDVQLCFEATATGTLYDVDLLSFSSDRNGCIDADGTSCAAADGGTSYTRIGGTAGTLTVAHPTEQEDEIDEGISLTRDQGREPIRGEGFEFTCGPCAFADFEGDDVNSSLREICGNQGPRQIVQGGTEVVCARHGPSGRTWDIELLSILSAGEGCFDGDDTTCTATGGRTSYVRTESDAFGDVCDNCIGISNDQTDADGDGQGDPCDPTPNDEFIAASISAKEKLVVKSFDGVKQTTFRIWQLMLRPDGTFSMSSSDLSLGGTWTDPKGQGKKFELALDPASEMELTSSLSETARSLDTSSGMPSDIVLGISSSKPAKLQAKLSSSGKVKLKVKLTLDASSAASGTSSSGKWSVKGNGQHTP